MGALGKTHKEWLNATAPYAKPDLKKSLWQVLNTFVPYGLLWVLMVRVVNGGYSRFLLLPLMVVAGGFLVRIFILLHDCSHHSFFQSRRANAVLGFFAGVLTFTAFEDWKSAHLYHHSTAADLDRRAVGDLWLLTVREYLEAPWWKRLAYRLYRSPWVMFGLGPFFHFFIQQRFPVFPRKSKERNSVVLTDFATLGVAGIAAMTIGLWTYLLIQVSVMVLAGTVGIWLFYVQHQFPGVYWTRHRERDPLRVALEGASYYRLPRVLRWFTGDIGIHHLHHLQPRIPNYFLQRCWDSVPEIQSIRPLTMKTSLQCLRVNLWDEEARKTVSFSELRRSRSA